MDKPFSQYSCYMDKQRIIQKENIITKHYQKTRSTPLSCLGNLLVMQNIWPFLFNSHHHTWMPQFTRTMAAHENTPNTHNVMKTMASFTMECMPKTHDKTPSNQQVLNMMVAIIVGGRCCSQVVLMFYRILLSCNFVHCIYPPLSCSSEEMNLFLYLCFSE